MAKKKSFDWDKAFAKVAAYSDEQNAKVAKANAKRDQGRTPTPATTVRPVVVGDLSELRRRLTF